MKSLILFVFLLPYFSQPKVFVSDKSHQPGNAQQISNLNKECRDIRIVGDPKEADFAVVGLKNLERNYMGRPSTRVVRL